MKRLRIFAFGIAVLLVGFGTIAAVEQENFYRIVKNGIVSLVPSYPMEGVTINSGKITGIPSINNINFSFDVAFGAKCDGVTDDSSAWTSAMSQASTLGGMRIFFPPGKTCFFSNTLTVSAGNLILDCGAGWSSTEGPTAPNPSCTLLFAAGNNITGIDTVAGTSATVTIKHLFIKGQATGSGSGNGVHLTSNAPFLEQNVIQGFGACGVSVDTSAAGAANNANFMRLVQNYSKLNKGDGFCFNSGANQNVNVGLVSQNTADSNGGWGFNILTGAGADLFETNHAVLNTSGAWQVAGTGNIFIGNYVESAATFILTAASSNNLVLSPAFGNPSFTDSGTNNSIFQSICSTFTVNNPCWSSQINLAPPPGTTGKLFTFRNGQVSANSASISDNTDGIEWMRFDQGNNTTFIYKGGTLANAAQAIGSGTVTTAGTAVTAGTCQAQTGITITGATVTDTAYCALNAARPASWQTGIFIDLPELTANTVTVRLCNGTAASITPAATAVRCTVVR